MSVKGNWEGGKTAVVEKLELRPRQCQEVPDGRKRTGAAVIGKLAGRGNSLGRDAAARQFFFKTSYCTWNTIRDGPWSCARVAQCRVD